jgi:hypothetical protein
MPGWDNTISSSQAFSSCNNSYHFEYSFSGYYVNCGAGCSYIGGVMNERTSSLILTY